MEQKDTLVVEETTEANEESDIWKLTRSDNAAAVKTFFHTEMNALHVQMV